MPPALFLVGKMINAILGTKIDQTQKFTEDGKRIPVTKIKAGPCYVAQIKTVDKDGYNAVQLEFGKKKREVKVEKIPEYKKGDRISVGEVFKVGDKVKVTGWSKGKGFTGVVKRWGFKGGPRTHGQSDRERAPGSIGQTTTPGRVYKGKKMAGRAGWKRVAISGLTVTDIDRDILEVKGLVPGPKNGLLIVQKYA